MENLNMSTHEVYCSLDICRLLKEVGFDWDTYSVYNKDGVFTDKNRSITRWNNFTDYYSAPTIDVAQRWLREVKHLEISIYYDPTIKSQPYIYEIYDVNEKFDNIFGRISPVSHSTTCGYFYTYEEALEAGIKKALELILEKRE